jgi:hypothetical protein
MPPRLELARERVAPGQRRDRLNRQQVGHRRRARRPGSPSPTLTPLRRGAAGPYPRAWRAGLAVSTNDGPKSPRRHAGPHRLSGEGRAGWRDCEIRLACLGRSGLFPFGMKGTHTAVMGAVWYLRLCLLVMLLLVRSLLDVWGPWLPGRPVPESAEIGYACEDKTCPAKPVTARGYDPEKNPKLCPVHRERGIRKRMKRKVVRNAAG